MNPGICGAAHVLAALALAGAATADIIYESGTLGPTGVAQGSVDATNITPVVFTGVRFELTRPVATTHIGGHFADMSNGTFFGAIIELDDENDFPNSGDLTTPDVLGAAELTFPTLSAEVFDELELSLDPGWHAIVFGSGLFGTSGDGAAPRNGMDISDPSYIALQSLSPFGWVNLTTFPNHRFVVRGYVIPEPSAILLAFIVGLLAFFGRTRIIG